MMSDEVKQAIDVIARLAISAAAEPSFSREIEWENYPEIGEYDWDAVVARVNEIRRSLNPPEEACAAAYALLTARSDS